MKKKKKISSIQKCSGRLKVFWRVRTQYTRNTYTCPLSSRYTTTTMISSSSSSSSGLYCSPRIFAAITKSLHFSSTRFCIHSVPHHSRVLQIFSHLVPAWYFSFQLPVNTTITTKSHTHTHTYIHPRFTQRMKMRSDKGQYKRKALRYTFFSFFLFDHLWQSQSVFR